MLELYWCPDSDSGFMFFGSYLSGYDYDRSDSASTLIRDIDWITANKRKKLLSDYVTDAAIELIESGCYSDDLIMIRYKKERDYGNRNS